MAGNGDMKACELCSEPSESQVTVTKKVKRGLWSYLYHRNVRETFTTTGQEDNGEGNDGATRLPKLTFTLALEGSTGSHKNVVLCENCSVEFDKLSRLDQQLECVKKAIETQVAMINQIQMGKGGQEKISGWIGSELDMSMGGSVVGTGNISMALQFLDNLCKGMAASSVSGSCTSQSVRLVQREVTSANNAFMNPVGELDASTAVTNPNCNGDQAIFGNDDDEVDGASIGTRQQKDSVVLPNSRNFPMESPLTSNLFSIKMEVETESVILKKEPDFSSGKSGRGSLVFGDLVEFSSTSCTSESHPLLPDPLATGGQFQSSNGKIYPDWSTNSARSSRKTTFSKKRRVQKRKRPMKTCNVCGKVLDSDLNRHMRVHTGAKPFKCDVCFKPFNQKNNLNRHKGTKGCILPTGH